MSSSLVLLTVEAKGNERACQFKLLVRVSGELPTLDFYCQVAYNLINIDFILLLLVITR